MLPPKRKRPVTNGVEELPWTEARCNRLLRTITSRISILRKISKSFKSNAPPRKCDNKESGLATQEVEEEPDWIPKGPRQPHVRPKYGGKSKASKPNPSPSRAVFSTPFVRRALGTAPTPGSADGVKSTRNHAPSQAYRRKMGLPVRPTDSAEEAEAKLVTALDMLLTQTASPHQEPRIGARSLSGACLRRVPSFVDLVYDCNKEDYGDEANDPTSSIYTQLEQLGTVNGGGWRGLREVVRAHAMHRLAQAIEEGLISDVTCEALLRRCGSNSTLPEASQLFIAWARRTGSKYPSPLLTARHRSIKCLEEISKANRCPELLLRLQASLLSTGVTDVRSLASSDPTIWRHLLGALLKDSTFFAGADFLKTAVRAMLEVPIASEVNITSTVKSAMRQIMSLTTGIVIARSSTSDQPEATRNMLDLSRDLVLLATQAGDGQLANVGLEGRQAWLPFFHSNLILECVSYVEMPEASRSTSVDAITTDFEFIHDRTIKEVQAFDGLSAEIGYIRNIANAIRVVDAESALVVLQRIFTSMLSTTKQCNDSPELAVLNRLALDASLVEADAVRDKDTRDLAEYIEKRLRGSQSASTNSLPATPRAAAKSAAFRWDEGLCEWLAQTPLSLFRRQAASKDAAPISKYGLVVWQDNLAHQLQSQNYSVQQSPDVLTEQDPNMYQPFVDESPVQNKKAAAVSFASLDAQVELHARSFKQPTPTKNIPAAKTSEKQALPKINLPPHREPLKRSSSESNLKTAMQKRRKPGRVSSGNELHSSAPVLDVEEAGKDELGIPTPAKKKAKPSSRRRRGETKDRPGHSLGSGKENRKSLPVVGAGRATLTEAASDDELGM
ncbi:hypothetical protein MBLNU230_g0149t1 [Neophaeotheca triangularis]